MIEIYEFSERKEGRAVERESPSLRSAINYVDCRDIMLMALKILQLEQRWKSER